MREIEHPFKKRKHSSCRKVDRHLLSRVITDSEEQHVSNHSLEARHQERVRRPYYLHLLISVHLDAISLLRVVFDACRGIDFDAYRIRVFPYRKNRIRLFPYESVPYTAFPVSLLSPYGYGVAVYAYEGVYTGFTLHHLCFFFLFLHCILMYIKTKQLHFWPTTRQ